MTDYKNVVFSASGITSWGDTWEWTFDGGVELKAPDGHTLLVTDLHTLDSGCPFEDDVFDRNFSMSQTQDTEWAGKICWYCYLLESTIYSIAYDTAWESYRSCIGQVVQDFKAKNPKLHCLTEEEFEDILDICLDTIEKQFSWGSEVLERLFNDYGPISVAVNNWLIDSLERQGLM